MEETDLFKLAGLSTSGVAIVLIVYRFLKSVKGKKFISSCCGKKMDVGFDVAEMTPPHISIPIENPLRLTRQTALGLPTPPPAERQHIVP
jgi:hypothetical protein